MELLLQMAGFDMAHVPYKGPAPANQDVIGRRGRLWSAGLARPCMPHVRSGKLVALARFVGIKPSPLAAGRADDFRSWGERLSRRASGLALFSSQGHPGTDHGPVPSGRFIDAPCP
jgi:hypothetical protein